MMLMARDSQQPNRHSFRDALTLSRDFSILLLSLAVVSLGFGILSPILPKYAEDQLGMSASGLGTAYSFFALAFALAMLPAGYLTDKIGRKEVIILGTLMFGATTYGLVLIEDESQFILLRILEGIGAALVTPAAFALTVDLVPMNRRGLAMGAQGSAQLMGALGGPGLGGLLAGEVGFYFPFYVAAGLAVFCAVLVAFIRRPSVHIDAEKVSILSSFDAWKRNAKQNKALTALTTRGFVMGIVQGLWNLGLIIFWYDKLQLTETEVGAVLTASVLVMMVGTIPFGGLADRYGRRPFLLLGGSVMAIGLALNAYVSELWQVFVVVAFTDIGASMSNPSVGATLADVMLEKERGRVMGAYQMVQAIGNIVGFFVLGVMYEAISPEAPILMCACSMGLATAIIAAYVKETRVVAEPMPSTAA